MAAHKTKAGVAGAVRILMVEDHEIVRQGLRRLLDAEADMEIAGEAGDGRTAMVLAQELQPDVVLMDIGLPDGDGIVFVRKIRARQPSIRFVILSSVLDSQHLNDAMEAGVLGYVFKTNACEVLVKAIREAMQNKSCVSSEVSSMLSANQRDMLRDGGKAPALSSRELEVLKRIAEGRNTKETASELGLSVKTVEFHRLNMMEKLRIHSVAELTKYAIREGIVSL